ncbi:hypothetical protein ACVWWG_003804 [Bradyrhizobium sp. LB7.2]
MELGKPRGGEEELCDQPVIGHCRFEIGAFVVDLHDDLALQRLAAELVPQAGLRQTLKLGSYEVQTDDVAEEMIRGHLIGILKVLVDESAVVEKCGISIEPLLVIDRPGVERERQRDGPIGRAYRDVHGAGPVDAETDRVGFHEIGDLVENFAGKAQVVAELPGLCQRQKMLRSRQLPRIFHVGIGRAHLVELPLLVRYPHRKSQAPHRIEIPVDGPIPGRASRSLGVGRHEGAAAEEIELMAKHPFGVDHRLPRLVGTALYEGSSMPGGCLDIEARSDAATDEEGFRTQPCLLGILSEILGGHKEAVAHLALRALETEK